MDKKNPLLHALTGLCCNHHPLLCNIYFVKRKLMLRPFPNIEIIIIETIFAFQLLIDQR